VDERETDEAQANEPFEEPAQIDVNEAVEEAEPYFPPTDPVVRVDDHGTTQIAGGFGDGDVPEVKSSAVAQNIVTAPPDEALEDAVRAELTLDASTAHLRLRVSVEDAVVTLRGEVADAADTDNALAVAGRVPGVEDVIDELTIT
jgi:hypothetical protein